MVITDVGCIPVYSLLRRILVAHRFPRCFPGACHVPGAAARVECHTEGGASLGITAPVEMTVWGEGGKRQK